MRSTYLLLCVYCISNQEGSLWKSCHANWLACHFDYVYCIIFAILVPSNMKVTLKVVLAL